MSHIKQEIRKLDKGFYKHLIGDARPRLESMHKKYEQLYLPTLEIKMKNDRISEVISIGDMEKDTYRLSITVLAWCFKSQFLYISTRLIKLLNSSN